MHDSKFEWIFDEDEYPENKVGGVVDLDRIIYIPAKSEILSNQAPINIGYDLDEERNEQLAKLTEYWDKLKRQMNKF